MSWTPDSFTPSWAGKSSSGAEPFVRGFEYLKVMQRLALVPTMVDVLDSTSDSTRPPLCDFPMPFEQASHSTSYYANPVDAPTQTMRDRICTWIGNYIDIVNARLNACLDACHECFYPEQRRPVHIFATPIAQRFGIDGFCNILVEPAVILIDVGRIAPQDWLSIVAHEYAHAHLGFPGHDQRFLAVMEHLCLGLGLEPPRCKPDMPLTEIETRLRNWPPYHSTQNPLAFWMGCY